MTKRALLRPLGYALVGMLAYGLLASSLPLPVEDPGPPPGLIFDPTRAMATVEHVTTAFPGRVTGTAGDETAAGWMADEFRRLGMVVAEQRFRAFGAFMPLGTDWRWHDGLNVVGVHRGEIDDVILFVAHRDVVPTTVQGADDNASGTGTLIELARALTATPHRHAYVFASLGAEEIGLGGAGHFVNHWPEMARVRLMLNFDMMGWRDAAGTELGHWAHLPLRTTSLLRGMIARDEGPFFPTPAKTFWRLAGIAADGGSDSGIFVMRGYPAIHFADGPPRPEASPHCYHQPCDVIEQVSAEALGRSGRFAEELVRRVDVDDHLGGPRRFLVAGDRYVPQEQVDALGVLVLVFALAQPVLTAMGAGADRGAVAAEWRRPARFWLGATVAAGLVALALPLSGLHAAPSWPRFFGWLGLVMATTGALAAWRHRTAAASPAVERLSLTAILALAYLGAVLLTNPLLAIVAGTPHILLSSRARLRRRWRGRLVDLALVMPGVLWSALWLVLAVLAGFSNYFPRTSIMGAVGLAYLAVAAPIAAVLVHGRARP